MTDFAFRIEADAGSANQAIDSVTSRLDNIAKQTAQSGKIINEKLRDIGKGMGFQLVAQGFDKLKDSLGGVSGAALGAAASGAAMGSTFAGPWGAAIGGAIGLTKGFVEGLLDEEKATRAATKAIEAQGKAYWDSIKTAQLKQRVMADLLDTTRQMAEEEKRIATFQQGASGARNSQQGEVDRLRAQISGYEDQLTRLEGRGGLDFATPVGPGEEAEKVLVRRKLRDAQLELEAATKSYGATLLPILKAENERKDRIADLEQIMSRQDLTAEAQKRLLVELNTLYRAGNKTLEEYNKNLEEMNALRERGFSSAYGGAAFARTETDASGLPIRNVAVQRSAAGSVTTPIGAPTDYTKGLSTGVLMWSETAAGKATTATEKWNAELQKHIELQQQIAQGIGSIGAEFINMAAKGEFSLEKLADALAKLALQLAATRIGGPWGAALSSFAGGLNLSGRATGGRWMVGGNGGTDQNIVAFRASNDERITVETPEDRRTGKYFGRGGGGGFSVTNVFQSDPREVVAANNTRAGQMNHVKLNRKYRRSS